MSAVADITTHPDHPGPDLETELNDVAGHLNAQHGRLVDLTIALLAEPTQWQGPGVWTMAQYLAWRVGIAPHRARQIVTIAERANELPTCIDALRRGELSIDQTAAIANRAPWWVDTQISALAKNLTVTQLRRTVNQYPFPHITHPDHDATDTDTDTDSDADGEGEGDGEGDVAAAGTEPAGTEPAGTAADDDNGEVVARDVCWFHTGDDDRFRLYLETDALTGAIIDTALTEARDALFHAGTTNLDWVDALRELANRSLDTITEPARRDRHRITIFLNTTATGTATATEPIDGGTAATDTSDGDTVDGGTAATDTIDGATTTATGTDNAATDTDNAATAATGTTDGDTPTDNGATAATGTGTNLAAGIGCTATNAVGWTVPDAIRRHLTCDGIVEPVFTADGLPVSVGRRQRIVPERTRRLIIHRDHGCRVPGCTNHRYLEIHHIIHWLDHGPTDTWNLIALCPHHHRLHHHGTLGITGNADQPDGVTFTFTNGDPITRTGATPTPPETPPPTPPGIYQHPLGERLQSRWLHFDPPPSQHGEHN